MPTLPRTAVLSLLVLVVFSGAALLLLIYAYQERLIFYPQPLDPRVAAEIESAVPRAEPFSIDSEDGARLQGWLLRGSGPRPWPLVIYFGGNAEEVSWLLPEWSRRSPWAVLLVNYRGYGASGGQPSEKAMCRDALALYDRITERADIDRRHIVAFGRSLGTGVATYLAVERPIAAVVLVSPYDSLVRVGQRAYPYLPVSLLLRHRFESVARAPAIKGPLLAIVAERDTVIAPERSRALAAAWGGPARVEVLQGVGHDDVHLHPAYWQSIGAFLGQTGGR